MAEILLIEDDLLVRQALVNSLETAGHRVHAASDGREGLRIFADFTPDLIITDIFMPETEGIETIVDIRKRDRNIPIIAMSGYAEIGGIDFLRTATALGANTTLKKPFNSVTFLQTVEKCLHDLPPDGTASAPKATASPS